MGDLEVLVRHGLNVGVAPANWQGLSYPQGRGIAAIPGDSGVRRLPDRVAQQHVDAVGRSDAEANLPAAHHDPLMRVQQLVLSELLEVPGVVVGEAHRAYPRFSYQSPVPVEVLVGLHGARLIGAEALDVEPRL